MWAKMGAGRLQGSYAQIIRNEHFGSSCSGHFSLDFKIPWCYVRFSNHLPVKNGSRSAAAIAAVLKELGPS
jgi:hypothetical protein